MREIKIRGQIKYSEEWNYLNLSEFLTSDGHPQPDMLQYLYRNIGQYTGLKDKNGVEIYEDDIILQKSILINIDKNEPVKDSDHENWYKVFWSEEYSAWNLERIKTTRQGNFGLGKIDWFKISITCIESELIGNIHEHPHLITQHKN